MGTMMEAGAPLLMSLRLRIELGRITEIETILFKPGGGGPNNIADMDKPFVPEPFWFKSIPPAERMSRQELIAVADGYFTGLQKNDGKGINGTGTYPFTEDCIASRTELQQQTVPAQPMKLQAPSTPWPSIASHSSSWVTISSFRTSTIDATPSSIKSAELCGLMPCLTRERSTREFSQPASLTHSADSTARPAFS